ncbi:MAG: T9SS type A sorting domain-containing protein [Chitinophagaceae bacterium]|nr:MAG: T9SS type A sorting domain-containing protein [Chitinophagaceae bacterium]
MRVFISWVIIFILWAGPLAAQQPCITYEHNRDRMASQPVLRQALVAAEQFAASQPANALSAASRGPVTVITIPVVVHILYHTASENISDKQVYDQLRVLNECFRRLNADSVNTPERFRGRAGDAGFEFKLAISDARRRSTSGIIRKYTPVTTWNTDDKMKFTSETGDDAWDRDKYLNIWVCNIGRIAGYSTFPGDDAAVDGIVISPGFFGPREGFSGKTTVHEAGHWLGLKHIWGDEWCGDDGVDDTPKQGNSTMFCPASGVKTSCDNGADGDMYMNYMDLTPDVCTNMFSEGQVTRMRNHFAAGGARAKLLVSPGLQLPLISEIPIAETDPTWLYANLYPNPARDELTIDFAFDIRWIGKSLTVTNAQGQVVSQHTINSKKQTIDISRLRPGYYFIAGKKEDGSKIQLKFIKI